MRALRASNLDLHREKTSAIGKRFTPTWESIQQATSRFPSYAGFTLSVCRTCPLSIPQISKALAA